MRKVLGRNELDGSAALEKMSIRLTLAQIRYLKLIGKGCFSSGLRLVVNSCRRNYPKGNIPKEEN